MKKLIYYYGDSPVSVEGFSKDCKRSRKGALHLLKGRPITITDDEYKHIQDEYKWALPKIRVVAQIKEEPKVEVKDTPKEPVKAKTEVTDKQQPKKEVKSEKPDEKKEIISGGKKVEGKKAK